MWLPRINQQQFFDLTIDSGECHNLIDESNYQNEIELWRNYLVHELEKRDCGWVNQGQLVSPPPTAPLVSDYKEIRYQG